MFSRGLWLWPGPRVVGRAATLHLTIYILSQLDVFETAFAIHGITDSWSPAQFPAALRQVLG